MDGLCSSNVKGKGIRMNNISKVRQALSEQDYGAIMVTSPASRLYSTGFASSAGVLLVTADDAWFFTDTRYIEVAGSAVKDAHVKLTTNDKPYSVQIKSVLDKNGITSVGFEDNHVTYAGYLEWTDKLGTKLISAQKIIDGLRAVKSLHDLEKMKEAQRISEKSFQEILPLICTEITEKQLATELIYRFLINGADDKAFDPIIVSGTKTSMPHGVPDDTKISAGFLTIDFGARVNGWCSDTTRTICIGKPDEEMINVYNTVLKAQEAGINAAHAGISGFDIDAAARTVIENAGYGEYFGHGFGHSIGLEVHESLRASQVTEDILPAGAVMTAEPGIYLPGRFGVRIEDTIYITDNGCINITNLDKNLIVL